LRTKGGGKRGRKGPIIRREGTKRQPLESSLFFVWRGGEEQEKEREWREEKSFHRDGRTAGQGGATVVYAWWKKTDYRPLKKRGNIATNEPPEFFSEKTTFSKRK